MIRLLLAAACAMLSIGQARADEVLHFGARPAWVASVAAPAAKPADGAFTIRLIDFQVRIDERGMHQYVRQTIRINTPEGLQAGGTVVVAWQPSYQIATVNGAGALTESSRRGVGGSGAPSPQWRYRSG